MGRFNPTEQQGIIALQKIINDFDWICREQLKVDMGIDAHIEVVDSGDPTGRLIGVQVKTGKSHFKDKDEYLVYYGELTHLNYWLNHSLPVIIVAHIPEDGLAYWQVVNANTITHTQRAWKIKIPKDNLLDEDSMPLLADLVNKSPEEAKLDRLRLDWGLMKHIDEGGKVNIYTIEYFHKTLGRGPFKLILIDRNGREVITKEWHQYYLSSLTRVLERHFPWASFEVDQDYYEIHSEIDPNEFSYYSSSNPYNLYPYEEHQGEAGSYRINLVLNDLGNSFKILMEYLESGN